MGCRSMSAQGGEDEHQKEKEEEGNGSEEAEFLRPERGRVGRCSGHGHAELQSGEKVFL